MAVSRNVYLKMKTLEEARKLIFERFPVSGVTGAEIVPVSEAVGRVLAEPVAARISSPNFHAAAMDGIAVKASSTFGVSEASPRELVAGKSAFYVNTGHVLPEGTDAVIMIEHVYVLEEGRMEIDRPVFPWQNVRKIGEDIVATELLFARNHRVTPYCIGALLSGGVYSVSVKRRPRVLIIPTGSELADWRETPPEALRPGQVLETNSFVLGALVESCGGQYVRHEKVGDDVARIREAVSQGTRGDFHMVLTVGGSSAGSEDYSRAVIAELGEVLVHGVTIMPGKPVIIGAVQAKPVFGVPGYPVSAIIVFEQLIRPLILRMLGQPETEPLSIPVEPTRKIPSRLGVEEFVRVKLGKVGDRVVATPLPRAAGSITSITEADGIIRIPSHVEGLKEHEPVSAGLLKHPSEIRNTIVIVGSHDNTLDVLADQLKAGHGQLSLSSSHVGSMGGLMAVKKGVCHLAGSHLLDTEDGTYNVSYLKRYLPDVKVRLVHLVFREQGLIVPRGNPKGIRGIEDLARQDVSFINRQGGSGTRILLDYRLKELNIDPRTVKGYDTEEYTHMSVAVAVLSGAADAGLGIYAAAKALGLDFIPVVTEQYDLVIPEIFFAWEPMEMLLATVRSEEFKKRVEALGGYSTRRTGEILFG